MAMHLDTEVTSLIDTLYEGTLDDSAWDQALVQCADLVGGSGVQLIAISPGTESLLLDEAHRMDPALLTAYRSYWHTQDILVPPGLRIPEGVPVADHQLMPVREFRRSAILNDFMRPFDAPHILVAWLHKSADKAVALSIKGTKLHGPFQEVEVQRLRLAIPHIQRAFRIRDRLEAANLRASSLSTCLDRVAFGVFLLDDVGRILETNSVAEDLLRIEPTITRDADRKLVLHGEAGLLLRQQVVTGKMSEGNTNGVIYVHRQNGCAPLSVVVTPIKQSVCGWISSHPRWLVLVFDPERKVLLNTALLEKDLGITPREAELVSLLSVNCNLHTAAIRLNIKFNTARSHLKSVLAKTGTHTQAELMRRVLTGLAAHATA